MAQWYRPAVGITAHTQLTDQWAEGGRERDEGREVERDRGEGKREAERSKEG